MMGSFGVLPGFDGLRVAVTIPPGHYFGGVDRAFALDMAGELCHLGANVLPVDTSAFVESDPSRIDAALDSLLSFRPDLALSLPNAAYALICNTPGGRNLFRDILQIPTVLIWDHGVLQFSQLFFPRHPDAAPQDCIERMRAELDHPLWIQYAPDRGHIAAMDRFGILPASSVHPFVHFAFPVYSRGVNGSPGPGYAAPRLAFAGNVYMQAAGNLPHRHTPDLSQIESRVLRAKQAQPTRSYWDLVLEAIDACPQSLRDAHQLHPESEFFWQFVYDEVVYVGNTTSRLDMLTSIGADCEVFGNFMEPEATSGLTRRSGARYRANLDCVTGLPWLYGHAELMVDVINSGYISGISPKVPSCLACGGPHPV